MKKMGPRRAPIGVVKMQPGRRRSSVFELHAGHEGCKQCFLNDGCMDFKEVQ